MFFSVHIEQLDADGRCIAGAKVEEFTTQAAAMALLRSAIRLVLSLRQPIALSLHDPAGRLLVCFTTKTGQDAAA